MSRGYPRQPSYSGMRLSPAVEAVWTELTAAIDREGPTPCAGRTDLVDEHLPDSAAELCSRCPVIAECREMGRVSHIPGVWGGHVFGNYRPHSERLESSR